MKTTAFPLRGVIFGALSTALCAQDPVLTTPGTATWLTEITDTGTRTIFTITDNTIFDWGSLNLTSGSELVFNFVGGESVANYLGGSGLNQINGNVTSNGIVGFFSPDAVLLVNGDITAKGVTLATLDISPGDFSNGGGFQLSGQEGASKLLQVAGAITATGGDVVLAGHRVNVKDTAFLSATGGVMIGGGREVSIAAAGNQRLTETSGDGFVLHLGETRTSRLEVAAGSEIDSSTNLGQEGTRVFLEVGEGGRISNQGTGVIIDDAILNGGSVEDAIENGIYSDDPTLFGGDGHIPKPTVSGATLGVKETTRPGGAVVNRKQLVSNSSPVSVSSDAARDRVYRSKRQVAKVGTTKTVIQRNSFFGMRGGRSGSSKKN